MKTKELIEYLQGFDAESEVLVIAENPKEPIICVEISNESDMDEKEITAEEQGEREAEQE